MNSTPWGVVPRRARRRQRRVLIVSFDIARDTDLAPSLAVGSLIAFARNSDDLRSALDVAHLSVGMTGLGRLDPRDVLEQIRERHDLRRTDAIALGAYAWSDHLISPLMGHLRRAGFRGDFIVGGYQITSAERNDAEYPDARYLIEGPADAALVQTQIERPHGRYIVGTIDGAELVSPYLSGVIAVPHGAAMARMETQRGCRWRCSFCSYRGLNEAPVQILPLERIRRELRLFVERKVAKLNVLDPEFNWSRNCVCVLDAMIDAEFRGRITVQARPENLVRAPWASEFLDRCERLNIHLEFGLQTADPEVSAAVQRRNDLEAVSKAFLECQRRGISFEVSLIYGLPLQTVSSFRRTLQFLADRGVTNVRAFPLMLHRGTALSLNRAKYDLCEEVLDGFCIPFVTSSSSYTRSGWDEMRALAEALPSMSSEAAARPSPAPGMRLVRGDGGGDIDAGVAS